MASPYTNYPPELTPEQKDYLVFTVKNWSIEHGLAVRPTPSFIASEHDPNAILATNAPVTLFPSPLSRVAFEHAQAIQKPYNELYARIAADEDWLEDVLKQLIDVDDFIENLWKCHLTVKKEGYVQDLSLGLFRSDYMVDTSSESGDPKDPSIKQVEFNTISSSFGGLAGLVTDLHKYLLDDKLSNPRAYPDHALFKIGSANQSANIPPRNLAVQTLAEAMAAAHRAYGPSKSSPTLPLCIIFLVQPTERNIFDQLAVSTYLTTRFSIPVFRLPVSSILTDTSIPSDNPSRPLIYTPPFSRSTPYEATLIYFRALYAPTEYNTPTSWQARTHLERSAAIKCPTVLTQLAGTKKVQQILTNTTTTNNTNDNNTSSSASAPSSSDPLRQFLPSPLHDSSTLISLRSTFAPQYDLSPHSHGLALALNPTTAANHVLKPQREGGGNNIYKTDIPPFLRSLADQHKQDEYKRWVLMELIHTDPQAKNLVLRSDGQVLGGDVISELGIFGGILWRKTNVDDDDDDDGDSRGNDDARGHGIDILHNTEGGYLLRTKGKDSNEGGVAAGFSSLDSVILY